MAKRLTLGEREKQASEFPKLVTSDVGTVLSLCNDMHIKENGDTICRYSTEDARYTQQESQEGFSRVMDLIQRLDVQETFDRDGCQRVGRCLELSYICELCGGRPQACITNPEMYGMLEEFLDYTFGWTLACDVGEAMNAVSSIAHYPATKEPGAPVCRFLIEIDGHSAGVLTFTTSEILFECRRNGMPYCNYISFPKYEELATKVIGDGDWYEVCWTRLFYQLFVFCGVACSGDQFIYAKNWAGDAPFDTWQMDGGQLPPERVSSVSKLLEKLRPYLSQYQGRKVYWR